MTTSLRRPMNNNGIIKIEQRQRYITEQIPVAVWEARLVYRIRQLTAAGDGEFIVRKRGDEVTICRIGKPEVVKE
jgi:hypothetical protein